MAGLKALAIVLVVVAAGVAVSLHYVLPLFHVRGVVSVPPSGANISLSEISLVLNITSPEGSETYSGVARLELPEDTCIQFRPVVRSVSKGSGFAFTLSGRVVLKPIGSGKQYSVLMPCIASSNMPCYRIQMLIPGYDQPLRVERGVYEVSLTLDWRAQGRGEFAVDIAVSASKCGEPGFLYRVVQGRPRDTSGWHSVEGSTRSYALLVEKARVEVGGNGSAIVWAWAWLFDPEGQGLRMFEVYLYNKTSGGLVGYSPISVGKSGSYYSVLLGLRLVPGDYWLVVVFPNGERLRASIAVEE